MRPLERGTHGFRTGRPPPASETEAEALGKASEVLGLQIGAAQAEAMLAYLSLLRRWNTVYNLTAVREPAAMVGQHLADCLAAGAALARWPRLAGGGRILDVGSGGGLPGVVLAILRADWSVTCIDSVAKKAAFVRQVAGALRLANLHSEHGRVEQCQSGPYDVVTARAFASLADLVRLSDGALAQGGCWMAMKGQIPQAEMAALPPEIDVFHVEPLAVPGLDAERCLVWMRRRRDTTR